jgi:hypothetical protein
MTSIIEIDPVDFAGGVAHVAAAQLFEFLSMVERDASDGAKAAVSWFGGGFSAANEDLQANVIDLARYVGRSGAGGEQLWRWGNINGIVQSGIPESGQFAELALAHRFAFDLFAEIAKIAHRQIDQVQIEIRKLEAAAIAAENVQALKLEDSIFEPDGSLGDMEPYQEQYLKDQQAADQARLEAEAAALVAQPEALSIGSVGESEEDKPESISVGKLDGGADEEGNADQGQEAGSEAAPDPSAQGDVSGLSDDGTAASDPAGQGNDDAGATPGEAQPVASEMGEQSSEATASSADQAGDGVSDGSKTKKSKSAE